jgi:negative regulator of sigma-B (phosphoserine phosphatase)
MELIDNEKIDCFAAENPLDVVNGDGVFMHSDEEHLFLAIFDGAGHGQKAHIIAQASCEFIKTNINVELSDLMSRLHENLRGTIGGVGIIGKLNYDSLVFRYVAIGNVVLRKIGNSSKRAVSQDGVIGYSIRTPREQSIQLEPNDRLIMYTDGITSTFDETDYPNIRRDNAEVIANHLISDFAKNNDDATCIVARVK